MAWRGVGPLYRSLVCFLLSPPQPSRTAEHTGTIAIYSSGSAFLFSGVLFFIAVVGLHVLYCLCVRSIHPRNTTYALVEQRLCLGVKL